MRHTVTALGAIAVLALGLFYWQRWEGEVKQPREESAAAIEDTSPTAARSEDFPTSANAQADVSADRESAVGSQETDGSQFVQRLHELVRIDPRLAVSKALDDRQRSASCAHAEARDMALVAALHNTGDIDGAKQEAWYYFMHYPNGQFTDYLSQLTRVRPPAVRPKR